MEASSYCRNIRGILVIFAANPKWPSPANLFVIPDESGFSMIDVGCGSIAGQEHLFKGLDFWGLDLERLHTVVLSHAHPDHMGAMAWILSEVHPRVLIHNLDASAAVDPQGLVRSFDISLAEERMGSADGFDLLRYFDQVGCPMSSVETVETVEHGDALNLAIFLFGLFTHRAIRLVMFRSSTRTRES
jgi:glyoxylase-like metal-dependent hydrolase (beta-lactamase superfamily II)